MSENTSHPSAPDTPLYRVPAHGHGKLRVLKPGESGNPTGQNGRYGEVVRMCREASPAITKRLIEIALDRNEEPRVSVVAAQEVLGRAYGKIPAEMKGDTAPLIDASRLSETQLVMLIEALRLAKAAGPTQPPSGA